MNTWALVAGILSASAIIIFTSRSARTYVGAGLIGFGVWLLPEPASTVIQAILEEGMDEFHSRIKRGQ